MKKVFAIMTAFIFILFLLNTLALAEEAQKKPDEKAKVETKAEIKEKSKEPVKETKEKVERMEIKKEVEGIPSRELVEMIRRQNEQIQQLREEIMRLRRMIEERLQPQVRRGEGEPPRRFEQDRPREEYQMREEQRPIDSEIRMLEDKLSREPSNFDARMRLAHLYDERGKIEAAIEQYKIASKIRPDYKEPLNEIERLMAQRREREARPDAEMNMGEVISSNKEYVTIKTLEGKTVAFKVPGEDIAEMAKKIDKGARVRIFWKGIEGQKVIRRIEFLEREQREEAKPMEDINIGEVISSGLEYITIKTLEGETATFKVPRVQKDNGEWVLNEDFAHIAKSLDKGKKVKIFWKKVEGERIITRIEQ